MVRNEPKMVPKSDFPSLMKNNAWTFYDFSDEVTVK